MFEPKHSADLAKTIPEKPLVPEAGFEVRTMPSKFLSVRPSVGSAHSPKGFKKNILVGLIIILLFGGAMALAAWFFLKSVKPKEVAPLTPAANVNTEPTTLNQQPIVPETPTTTASSLPEEELRDINTWQYFEDAPYHYSFKYPNIWSSAINNESPSTDYLKQVVLAGRDNAKAEDVGKLEINIYQAQGDDQLASWLSSNLGLSDIDLESYKLNNEDAYRYDDVALNTYSIFSLYGGYIYELKFYKTDLPILKEVYNQFIINWEFFPLAEEEAEEVPYQPAVDSDADGLTDVEETLYSTDPGNADTDGDTYKDGSEIINLYNPKVSGSAKIYDSDLVKTYVNNSGRYNLIYPSTWEVKESGSTVILQSGTGEFVQISLDPNTAGYQDIKSWYAQYLQLDPAKTSALKISGDLPAILSADQMRVYFIFGDNIYSLIYNINLRKDGNFLSTYNMILKSFKLLKTE